MSDAVSSPPLAVVALGGNALLRRGEPATAANQLRAARAAAEMLGPGSERTRLVVTHGNGPQVGLLALKEDAYGDDGPYPLDVLDAESGGQIGYVVELELDNVIDHQDTVTVITRVLVDADDPVGIIHAFARHVRDQEAFLVVAGPAAGAIEDDPEGGQVLSETCAAWRRLPAAGRRRIQLATLPMADLAENALIVNALQREAAVIVKKSLQEGFGLGVTEGMWKAKPVVATRVGGHRDQIEHRRTGLLVDDPTDLPAFAAAIDECLADPALALELGSAGREQVRARYLADRHFVNSIDVLRRLPVGLGVAA